MDYSKYLSDKDSEHIKKYKCQQYAKISERHKNDVLLPKNAHLRCISIGCVGNLAFAIHHLYYFKGECEKIYMDFTKKSLTDWENKENPYDKIFNQVLTKEFVPIPCAGLALFDYDETVLDDIRKSTQHFFSFNQNLIDVVDKIVLNKNIGNKTLGVHIRMNDWNAWHGGQLGIIRYDDYVKEIDMVLKNNDINNIFIASDNVETLEKLKQRYGIKLVWADDVSREKNEEEIGDENSLRIKAMNRLTGEFNFITPFIDLLSLMKCEYLIARKYSNFSSTAIFLGNMKFKNIFILPKTNI